MSRSAVPSTAQIETLLECLDRQRFLATGHARTVHARDTSRAAWEQIALKLNSNAGGCIKTWQQWAKYWKDKKGATKRKVSQINLARRRTGGGVGDPIILSSVEEKIVAIMGGEGFALGDRELEINPFHASISAQVEMAVDLPVHNMASRDSSITFLPEDEDTELNLSQSILQQDFPGPSTSRDNIIAFEPEQPHVLTGPSNSRDNNIIIDPEQPIESSPQPASSRRRLQFATPSPRRRRPMTARRRLLHRTPPSQRRSHTASLTERFVAIEEQRLENERVMLANQQRMFDMVMEMNERMSRQTQALMDLCAATRALAERSNQN